MKGNSKTGIAESYRYDAANQMTAYAVNGNTALENLYNGNGQRVRKTECADVLNNQKYRHNDLTYLSKQTKLILSFLIVF